MKFTILDVKDKSELWVKVFDDSPFNKDDDEDEDGKILCIKKSNIKDFCEELLEHTQSGREK